MKLTDRAVASRDYRHHIANRDRNTDHPDHVPNQDESVYHQGWMNFTKGLEHHPNTGLADENQFMEFRKAIDDGLVAPFDKLNVSSQRERQWEAPTAGFVFDPQGPDAQGVTMAPAPAINTKDGSFDELAFEMAEVYELALLRDVPFSEFSAAGSGDKMTKALGRLNALAYAKAGFTGNTNARPRKSGAGDLLDRQTAFRGSSHGVDVGPYLSCFLLMGNGETKEEVKAGQITFGNQTIDQRVKIAPKETDFLQDWDTWLEAQNGVNLGNRTPLFPTSDTRFMYTPRDLAAYVHDDALYQAYLNACLLLLGMKAPFEPSFDRLSGMGPHETSPVTGFALFGGPHILSLVTEVATRALKAVRWQKFNVHLRLRPEALAARVARAGNLDPRFQEFRSAVGDVVGEIEKHNEAQGGEALLPEALLPMAFPEGSPMHPTYGAGHATVAGACVTVLKAFFNTDTVLTEKDDKVAFRSRGDGKNVQIVPLEDGCGIEIEDAEAPLTLLGELNKLAANISIGRNMAGVHYFSDYYDSLRMGEKVADGIMRDQAEGYPKDRFVMSYVPYGSMPGNPTFIPRQTKFTS